MIAHATDEPKLSFPAGDLPGSRRVGFWIGELSEGGMEELELGDERRRRDELGVGPVVVYRKISSVE